jgi:hypothetical protein
MSKEVLESTDVILNNTDTDLDLSQTLANTRLLLQDEEYTIENTQITGTYQINSFFDSLQRTDFLNSLPDNATILSSSSNTPLTVGKLTPDHISQYPHCKISQKLIPIDPFTIQLPNGDERKFEFVSTNDIYVIQIQLYGSNKDRQTVYTTVDTKERAEKLVADLGQKATLSMSNNELVLKTNTQNNTTKKTERISNRKATQKLVTGFILSVLAVFSLVFAAMVAIYIEEQFFVGNVVSAILSVGLLSGIFQRLVIFVHSLMSPRNPTQNRRFVKQSLFKGLKNSE